MTKIKRPKSVSKQSWKRMDRSAKECIVAYKNKHKDAIKWHKYCLRYTIPAFNAPRVVPDAVPPIMALP